MSLSPSFQQATEALSLQEYQRLLQAASLADITLERVNASVDRATIADAGGSILLHVSSREEIVSGIGETPDILFDYDVRGKRGRKTVLSLKLEYRLRLNVDGGPLPSAFYVIYAATSGHSQVWPFARELAHSLTSRMGIPILLPLLRPGSVE